MFYTLGQRHGMGIGEVKNHSEAPWFVLEKDLEKNQLIIGQERRPSESEKTSRPHGLNSPSPKAKTGK